MKNLINKLYSIYRRLYIDLMFKEEPVKSKEEKEDRCPLCAGRFNMFKFWLNMQYVCHDCWNKSPDK
jgi:DNA-directed RNA polymerase subunit RPC12/RpoP